MQNDKNPAFVRSSLTLFLLALTTACVFSAAAAAQVRPTPPLPSPASDAPSPRVAPEAGRPARGDHGERPEAEKRHLHSPELTAGRNLHTGPSGRWWDDASYSRSLAISSSQQRRMDQVFSANRDQLLKLYTNLKHQEVELDKLGKAASETALDQQIDRVSQARTDLEKADTHLLLEIRKQLTPDQVNKLDAAQQ